MLSSSWKDIFLQTGTDPVKTGDRFLQSQTKKQTETVLLKTPEPDKESSFNPDEH